MPSENDEKLSKIDASTIGDHAKIGGDDVIYYWKEYTSGRDYTFGYANNLISNLKKKPTSTPAVLRHKQRVIRECGSFFSQALNPDWLREAVLVPVPGSKASDHPDFDDRLFQICSEIKMPFSVDVRRMIYQNTSTAAAHEGHRATVEELLAIYEFDEAEISKNPIPRYIGIFDDVLTAGVHYRAMYIKLRQRFPENPIVGLFVARRIFPNDQAVEDVIEPWS